MLCPAEATTMWPGSQRVGNVKNNDAGLTESIALCLPMSLWPSEEPPRPNGLRAHREYWIQGAPTRGNRRRARWWWTVSGVVLLALILGVAHYSPMRRMQVAGPATAVAVAKASAPERIPTTSLVPSNPPTPKLVVGLHPMSGPPDQQGVNQAQAPNPTSEPHYAVGLPPITEQTPPPPGPVVVASPSEATPVTPPAPIKPSPKRALPGPPTHPTSGQVRF